MAWSRVYRIYYDKSRRLSLSSSGRKARYLSYIQNSYASMHSFGTPSITPCSVIPPSCPTLSAALVVVAIGPAGSVPIGRGDPCGTVRSVRGPVGVVVRFGVRSFGSEFWVGLWGFTHHPFHRLVEILNIPPLVSREKASGWRWGRLRRSWPWWS